MADLVEMQPLKRWNRGTWYLLTVIDVLSKYAWVAPLKSKTGKAVTVAFEGILRGANGRRPHRLQTDKGKEFYNVTFGKMLDRHSIRYFLKQRGWESVGLRTVQSDLERTYVPVLYGAMHAKLRVGPACLGRRV